MKNRILAVLLAIFFGSLGIENFYLNQPVRGIFSILFSWTGIPGLIGLIKGIYWLFISDVKFNYIY